MQILCEERKKGVHKLLHLTADNVKANQKLSKWKNSNTGHNQQEEMIPNKSTLHINSELKNKKMKLSERISGLVSECQKKVNDERKVKCVKYVWEWLKTLVLERGLMHI